MNSKLSGILQTILFFISFVSIIYLFLNFNIYYLLGALLIFKFTQTFGSGLTLHIWISHNQYNLNGFIKWLALICTLLAGVNRPQFYSRYHTIHHKYVDTIKDPHSPSNCNKYYLILGLWTLHAYKFDKYLNKTMTELSLKVINSDKHLKFIDKYYYLIIFSFISLCMLFSVQITMYFILLPLFLNNLDGNYFFIYLLHKNGKAQNIKLLNYWMMAKGGDHYTHHRFLRNNYD